MDTFVGVAGEKFENVRRIAVLRGGGLGDLMFAMPAVHALAEAYPEAEIVLLGNPSARAVLDGRPSPISEIIELPIAEGVRPAKDSESEDPAELADFFQRMQERHFDLAVQLHGGGRFSNPFLLNLGARHTIGTRTEDAAHLERTIPYIYYQNEFLRGLEVVALAGAPAAGLEAKLQVTQAEVEDARARRLPDTAGLLVIHPGATDPRRRWPAESFAEVAGRALNDAWQVLIVGDNTDAEAAHTIVELARARHPELPAERIQSLAGQISLSELLGILASADVVLGNDSGPRHMAVAVGAKTVGLFWMGNLINAGPMGRGQHRVHLSWVTRCPVCGVDVTQVGWTAERCEHDPSYLQEISPDAVYHDVQALASGN